MEKAVLTYLDEEREYDISHYIITSHAFAQYSTKCFPAQSLLGIRDRMKEKLKKVKKVDLNKKIKKSNRLSYIDEDDIIYITEGSNVITAYPNERIFVSKTFYFNRKCGQRYL